MSRTIPVTKHRNGLRRAVDSFLAAIVRIIAFVWPPNGTNPEPTRHHGPGAMPAATLCACDSVIVNRGSGCGTTRTKASRDSTGRDAIVDCLVRWRHRCNGTTGTHTPA